MILSIPILRNTLGSVWEDGHWVCGIEWEGSFLKKKHVWQLPFKRGWQGYGWIWIGMSMRRAGRETRAPGGV